MSVAPEATPTAFDHGVIPDDLVGTWSALGGANWTLDLRDDGTFQLLAQGGELDAVGSFGVFEDEILFRDEDWGSAGGPCGPEPSASYAATWEITDGTTLVFVPTENAGCTDRWTVGSPEGWERRP